MRGFEFIATERDKAVGADKAEPDLELGRRFGEIGRQPPSYLEASLSSVIPDCKGETEMPC